MENELDNAQTVWVDDCLARLKPPAEWRPDSETAFKKFMERQRTTGNSRWLRVSSVGAIVMGMVAVLALLPWHFFWNPQAGNKSTAVEPVKAEPLAVTPQVGNMAAPTSPAPSPVPLKVAPPAVTPPVEALTAPPSPVPPPATFAAQQPAAPAQEQEEKPVERVGKGVTAPSCPRPTVEPSYTDEARRERIQGTVTLDVIIGADGAAKVVRVVEGLGYGLDENARAFAEQYKCKPATMDGKPVAVSVRMVVNFHLY